MFNFKPKNCLFFQFFAITDLFQRSMGSFLYIFLVLIVLYSFLHCPEAVSWRCSLRKIFENCLQNSRENDCYDGLFW